MAKGPEAAARCPTTPPPQLGFGKLAVGVCVNGLERIAQTHRTAKLSVLPTEVVTMCLPLWTEIPGVPAQSPHPPFGRGPLALQWGPRRLGVFARQHHDVELVKDDP